MMRKKTKENKTTGTMKDEKKEDFATCQVTGNKETRLHGKDHRRAKERIEVENKEENKKVQEGFEKHTRVVECSFRPKEGQGGQAILWKPLYLIHGVYCLHNSRDSNLRRERREAKEFPQEILLPKWSGRDRRPTTWSC